MTKRNLIVGTRGSDLALTQTRIVVEALESKNLNLEFALKVIHSSGDEVFSDSPIIGTGKDMFTKELDSALLVGEIDLAVHSLKDVPSYATRKSKNFPEVDLVAFPRRESPFDILISKKRGRTIDSLPAGAKIGTSSVRRKIQIEHHRPDLEIVEVHGNVLTRIRKLREGNLNLDAIVLAEAGINRLGIIGEIDEVISSKVILPAPGQGCLAIAVRLDDVKTKKVVKSIDDYDTRQCVLAERAFSQEFGGDCNLPVAALATLKRGSIQLEAMAARNAVENRGEAIGGDFLVRQVMTGSANNPKRLGKNLAAKLKKKIGERK
jgi:hydroxymethylbilane synthase